MQKNSKRFVFVFYLQLEDKEEEKKELEKRLQGLNSDGEERQLS